MKDYFDAESALDELSNIIGVKEPIKTRVLKRKIKRGKIETIVYLLASQCGLPIRIIIRWLDNFGIPAKVQIPNDLPFFGSPKLVNFPIVIKVSSSLRKDSDVLPMILAHEIAHILLHSLNFRHKESEQYTDIAAISLGFQEIFRYARKIINEKVSYSGFWLFPSTITTTINTTTKEYGYLTDEQFRTVLEKTYWYLAIEKEAKRKLLKRFKKLKQQLTLFHNNIERLKSYLKYLDNNRNTKLTVNDVKRISILFHPNTLIELDEVKMQCQDLIDSIEKAHNPIIHYFSNKYCNTTEHISELERQTDQLSKRISELSFDIKILRKYRSAYCNLLRSLGLIK